MTNNVLTQALKEAYASAPTDTVILHTLEIYHSNFTAPIRVVKNHTNITATIEAAASRNAGEAVEFIAFSFDISLPEITERANPEITITIDNVGKEISDNLELAAQSLQPVIVIYRPYLSTDLTTPQYDPPVEFIIESITVDTFRVVAKARSLNMANRAFPTRIYMKEEFPYIS